MAERRHGRGARRRRAEEGCAGGARPLPRAAGAGHGARARRARPARSRDKTLARRATIASSFEPLTGDRVAEWIAHQVTRARARRSPTRAVDLLHEAVGNDLPQLDGGARQAGELHRGAPIDEAAVAASSACAAARRSATCSTRRSTAMRAARSRSRPGAAAAEDGAVPVVMALTTQIARARLGARALRDRGTPPGQLEQGVLRAPQGGAARSRAAVGRGGEAWRRGVDRWTTPALDRGARRCCSPPTPRSRRRACRPTSRSSRRSCSRSARLLAPCRRGASLRAPIAPCQSRACVCRRLAVALAGASPPPRRAGRHAPPRPTGNRGVRARAAARHGGNGVGGRVRRRLAARRGDARHAALRRGAVLARDARRATRRTRSATTGAIAVEYPLSPRARRRADAARAARAGARGPAAARASISSGCCATSADAPTRARARYWLAPHRARRGDPAARLRRAGRRGARGAAGERRRAGNQLAHARPRCTLPRGRGGAA